MINYKKLFPKSKKLSKKLGIISATDPTEVYSKNVHHVVVKVGRKKKKRGKKNKKGKKKWTEYYEAG